MTSESILPVGEPVDVQAAWNRFCDRTGFTRTNLETGLPFGRVSFLDRLRFTTWWLPFLGRVRLVVQAVAAIAVVGFIAYSMGSRHPSPAPAPGATTDLSNGLPAQTLDSTKVFRAPAGDSLQVSILNGSSATLAPGAVLTITPRRATDAPGALADLGSLRGFARFDINDQSKRLALRTISGEAVLERGVTEVNVVPDTLTVRAFTGAAQLRPAGFWSWKPGEVHPGFELRAITGHLLLAHSAKRIGAGVITTATSNATASTR